MRVGYKIALWMVAGLFVLGSAALLLLTRSEGHKMVTFPLEDRDPIDESPADYGLAYEDVTVTTADGVKLVGWYIPSQNGAVIILQHGFKNDREELLIEAAFLHQHGYGVLLSTVRTHDLSEGELVTWGRDEMLDLEAWYRFLLGRADAHPERIGALGKSFGAAMLIKYAAQNEKIKAVVADSAFSSLDDSVAIGVKKYTGLPPFPFAPLIVFWAEREAGIESSEIDTTLWIRELSPRPVFILQGGADDNISVDSGRQLYEAAGEPKEFWFEPTVEHADFELMVPEEYEARVLAFFDLYLLGE